MTPPEHRKVTYSCQVKDSARTPACRNFSATAVDDAVATLFLETITPEQVAVAVTAASGLRQQGPRE